MKYEILCKGLVKEQVNGKKHRIKLSNGETVVIGISNDGYAGNQFVATDIKSGLALTRADDEEFALSDTKERLEYIIKNYGDVDTFRQNRLKQLKELRGKK